VANPDYRGFIWDVKSSGDKWDDQIIKTMHGKQMPQIGRVEVSIIEEEQARWLAFDSGQLDFEQLSDPASPNVLLKGKLKPEYAAKGISLYRYAEPGNAYSYFNFKDPLVGGFSLEKQALRRAIAMSYAVDEEIAQVRFGQAVRARAFVPPGVAGFDPAYRNSIAYDPALANKLLDRFGYKRGADGFRTLPDGKPLLLKMSAVAKVRDMAIAEIWKRSLDKVGIRVEFKVGSFADNLKAAYRCELQMWFLGGTAGIPDGVDFFEAYYGPNAYAGNFGCYQSPTFDAAYEKARLLPDGPERQVLYTDMQRIMEGDTAQVLTLWRLRNWLIQPWVQGYKTHPILHGDWKYLDIVKH
jgi:ABC-type transport system substrate-binding protein